MKPVLLYGAGMVLVMGLAGCGGDSPPPLTEQETSSVAQQSVTEFAATARKQPAQAPQRLTVLMESLDSYAQNEGGPYETLRDRGKELLELYNRKAPQAEIDAKLNEFEQAAQTLGSS